MARLWIAVLTWSRCEGCCASGGGLELDFVSKAASPWQVLEALRCTIQTCSGDSYLSWERTGLNLRFASGPWPSFAESWSAAEYGTDAPSGVRPGFASDP
eukprot:4892410-Amphidinium_carterae.1